MLTRCSCWYSSSSSAGEEEQLLTVPHVQCSPSRHLNSNSDEEEEEVPTAPHVQCSSSRNSNSNSDEEEQLDLSSQVGEETVDLKTANAVTTATGMIPAAGATCCLVSIEEVQVEVEVELEGLQKASVGNQT